MSLAENLSPLQVERTTIGAAGHQSVVPDSRNNLKAILIASDASAIVVAWCLATFGWAHAYRSFAMTAVGVLATVIGGLWILHAHGLYLARTSNIRLVELARVARSATLIGVMALAGSRVIKVTLLGPEIIVGSFMTLLLLVIGRSAYRAWVTTARRSGRYSRDVVIVGTNAEAATLLELLADHPEAGLRAVGVVGERSSAVAHGLGALWCGPAEATTQVLNAQGANGVIIAAGALGGEQLSYLIRELQARQAHVHLSSGVRGVDYRRLRALPLAHEPLLYIESTELSWWQHATKRAMDVAVASLLLLIASPVLLLTALAIKLQDRGPVFFKQVRVGKDDVPFKVFKFRSMVLDAEARLKALQADNQRSGPLFKMDRDPRVTRIGHFLRSSSIDELPQLLNVLRGEMSLVGPRPALPAEVARFDDALLGRSKVQPGITGLWQVEARDNPNFSAYRRLDLFYVENWSVTLDLVILLATAEQVIARLVRILRRGGKGEDVVAVTRVVADRAATT